MSVQSKISPAPESAAPLVSLDAALMQDVRVILRARLGEIDMSVSDLLSLKAGEVLTLDRLVNEPIDLYLNQALVARGEIVAVDDHYGVRLVEVAAAS